MASQFNSYLRKNQKLIVAAVGVVLMITWVVGPFLLDAVGLGGRSGADKTVVTFRGGRLTESEIARERMLHTVAVNFCRGIVTRSLALGGKPSAPMLMVNPQTGEVLNPGIDPDSSELSVVRRMLLARKARAAGVVVDKEAVKQFLSRLSDFVVTEGDWIDIANQVTPRDALVSVQQLLEHLESELLAQHEIMLIRDPILSIGTTELWDYFNRLDRRASIEAYPIDVKQFVSKVPDPAANDPKLRALFEEGKDNDPDPASAEPGFHRPARIAFGYLKVDFDKYLEIAKKQVTEEQIQKQYDLEVSQGKHRVEVPAETPKPEAPATETPAPETPATETPKPEAPAGETPKPETPAEEPKPEAAKPEAAKPEAEKPAEEKPAEPAPEAAKPEEAKPETPAEKPAEEAKPEGGCQEEPAPEKPAEEKPADAPAEKPAEEAKPAEEKPAEEKPAEPAEKPAAETPATETPAAEPPAGEKPADPALPPTTPPAPAVKPLAEVREAILNQLAQPIASEMRTTAVKGVIDELRSFSRAYNSAKLKAETAKGPKPELPALDLPALSKKYNLESGTTELMSAAESYESELGKNLIAIDFSQGFQQFDFAQIAYSGSDLLYNPREMMSRGDGVFGNGSCIFWRTQEEPAADVTFDEVKDDVIAFYKMKEALTLAKEEAQKYVDKVKAAGSVEKAVPDAAKVVKPAPFSWFTAGFTAMGMGSNGPTLSDVDGIPLAGDDFRRAVFDLKPGEACVAVDQPGKVVYVVRMISDEPSEEIRREKFLETGASQQVQQMAMIEARQSMMKMLNAIDTEYSVKWLRPIVFDNDR